MIKPIIVIAAARSPAYVPLTVNATQRKPSKLMAFAENCQSRFKMHRLRPLRNQGLT